jgi:hypothetical protein
MYPTSELHAINRDIETKNCMMRVVWHGVLPTQLGPPPCKKIPYLESNVSKTCELSDKFPNKRRLK